MRSHNRLSTVTWSTDPSSAFREIFLAWCSPGADVPRSGKVLPRQSDRRALMASNVDEQPPSRPPRPSPEAPRRRPPSRAELKAAQRRAAAPPGPPRPAAGAADQAPSGRGRRRARGVAGAAELAEEARRPAQRADRRRRHPRRRRHRRDHAFRRRRPAAGGAGQHAGARHRLPRRRSRHLCRVSPGLEEGRGAGGRLPPRRRRRQQRGLHHQGRPHRPAGHDRATSRTSRRSPTRPCASTPPWTC